MQRSRERASARTRRRRASPSQARATARTSPARPPLSDPLVGILVGSESDRKRMQPALDELEERGIAYEFSVRSAHREPEDVAAYCKTARQRGERGLICGAGLSAALAGFVANWSRERGLDVELVGPDDRPSVIATVRGSGGGRSLLLNAHLDTVGVAGMDAPLEPRIEHGRMYGRGTYDMKGGLAAIMDAAAKCEGLRGDVIVTAVADEELASIGTAAVLEPVRADAAIVVEPT